MEGRKQSATGQESEDFMKYFTKLDLSTAMNLTPEAMDALLLSCGISGTRESLSEVEVRAIQHYLQQQSDGLSAQAQERLERTVEQYTVLVDTCSLLHYQFSAWMEHMLPILRRTGKQLVIPGSILREMGHLADKKPELAQPVRTATGWLNRLHREGLLAVYGGNSETFGDHQLLTAATQFHTKNRLLVVTQDKDLATDLMGLNQLNSVQGKKVLVLRINKYGYLSRFHPDAKQSGSSCSFFPPAPLVEDDQQILPLTQLPATGDEVIGTSGTLILGDALGRGGEGTIYDLGDGTVAKLYHPEKRTAARRDKLQLMVTAPIREQGICWPQELLCNAQGEFVGYRMPRASGTSLQRCLLNQNSVQRYFPSGQRAELARLAVTILEKLQLLHRSGVLLGDINLNNILMVSPSEVWLVDCDSYQVGGYPCPVGKSPFLPPELLGKHLSQQLRTPGNEAFAVATLLFMLMLPGKAPYAQQGGDSMENAIREGNFPYPCGDNHGSGVPEGPWRYQWSHLPLYIKQYFHGTFQKEGRFYAEEKRLPVSTWLSVFRRYLELLETGALQGKDEQSGKIYPNRLKEGGKQPRQVSQRRICQMCGEEFDLSQQEENFYRSKGFFLPQTCPRCRQLKRMLNQNSAGSQPA